MPKYFDFKVAGCFLYFTSKCVVEAMHVHANHDGKLRETGAAKFFVKGNGDTIVQKQGDLTNPEKNTIQKFIKAHYLEMYSKRAEYSNESFFNK